jgi:hypothetical protein
MGRANSWGYKCIGNVPGSIRLIAAAPFTVALKDSAPTGESVVPNLDSKRKI